MKLPGALLAAGMIVFGSSAAHATDIVGARASGSVSLSPDTLGWTAMLGGTYELFADNWGGRLGFDLGYLQYERGGRQSQFLTGVEVAAFRGADDAQWRSYLVLEPLLSASSQVFEGLRVGPEFEWRDVCRSNLRAAVAALYQPLRNTGGVDWAMFGARLSLTWGLPTQGCVRASLDTLPGQ